MRRSNLQPLEEQKPELYRTGAATIHELPRRRAASSVVPRFVEVGAPRKWNRMGVSLLLHAAAIMFLVRVAVWLPKQVQIMAPRHESVTLIAPSLERPVIAKTIPSPPPKVLAELRAEPKLPTPPPSEVVPKTETPPIRPAPAPEPPTIATPAPAPVLPKPPVPEKKVVEGMFDSGSSAKPTIKAPVREVQTGCFGDPNGVAGKSNNDRKLTVASVGAFDMPTGPGNGNGAAGSHGKQGLVASAGFGDGIAGDGTGERARKGDVSTGGFGDATLAQASAKKTLHVADSTPVEILFKPRPAYTPEARQMHIEGEVLLDVMFGASGHIRVLRVVKGLGHGLDESAQRAAQQIRFNPAKRDGQPYDSDAVVHIVFALAE